MNALRSLFTRRAMAEIVPAPLLEYQSPTASLIAEEPSAAARNVIPILAVFVVVLVILSMVVPINKVITGYGTVVTDKNIEVIQPLETSIVRMIAVEPGQTVKKGDLLARLDPTFTQSDLGSLQAQFDSAQADVERLTAEAAEKSYVPSRTTTYTANSQMMYQQDMAQYKSTLISYDTKIKSLQSTYLGAQADVSRYGKEMTIADKVLGKRAELERLHVGSQLDLLSAQSQSEELHRLVETAQSTMNSAKQDLASMDAERDAYKQSFIGQQAQALAGRTAAMNDAESQLAKTNLRRQLVDIRAEQDGSVLTVATVTPGTVLQSGDQLITIQPVGKAVVQIDFPAEMAGDLHVGQKVAVKFTAFNYATHGQAYGTLTTLTAGSFLPGQQQQSLQHGVSGGGSSPSTAQTSLPTTEVVSGLFYQGTVVLNHMEMRGVPKDFVPSPGMSLTADAIVGTQTVMDILFERIMPAFTEIGNTP
jgi:hemolysin D